MRTVRILFFDDSRERHDRFVQFCDKAGLNVFAIEHAYTIEQAIQLLDSTRFERACLDHDLDGMVGVPPGPLTGLAVAQHIAAMPEDRAPTKVIIHSQNPEGAHAMLLALGRRARADHFESAEFWALVRGLAA